jgi:hypothetical protein
MVSLGTSLAALAPFQSNELLGFAVQFLHLPTMTRTVNDGLRGSVDVITDKVGIRSIAGTCYSFLTMQAHPYTFIQLFQANSVAMLAQSRNVPFLQS